MFEDIRLSKWLLSICFFSCSIYSCATFQMQSRDDRQMSISHSSAVQEHGYPANSFSDMSSLPNSVQKCSALVCDDLVTPREAQRLRKRGKKQREREARRKEEEERQSAQAMLDSSASRVGRKETGEERDERISREHGKEAAEQSRMYAIRSVRTWPLTTCAFHTHIILSCYRGFI